MKRLLVLTCALAWSGRAFSTDHGPVFSYATPVNSQSEVSYDTGIYDRNGTHGTQLSTGSGFGYGLTPHITVTAFLPATFGSGSLPESRIMPGSEWTAGASWRFLHSVTSVGKRIESTGSLGIVVPGPQQDAGLLSTLHRAPGVETIHPFLDGNGRVGRLLITFMLKEKQVLHEPVLYLSLFFKKHRRLYYDRLNGTRKDDGWKKWLDFFLQGVRDTANQAVQTAIEIDRLFRADKEKIDQFGRGAPSALLVYQLAQASPIFSIKHAARQSTLSFPTASAAIQRLTDAGILQESSGRRRDRLFLYAKYLDVLNRDL